MTRDRTQHRANYSQTNSESTASGRGHRRYLRSDRATARISKEQLRKGSESAIEQVRGSPKPREIKFSSILSKKQAGRVNGIIGYAEFLGVGSRILLSPAERQYQKAKKLLNEYGDRRAAVAVDVRVAERLVAVGRLGAAFERVKLSGDREAIGRLGTKIAKEYKKRADSIVYRFTSSQRVVENCRKGMKVAVESENIGLANDIGMGAAKRFEDYGDSCAHGPVSSVSGLVLGYVRAIRWLKACGDEKRADRVSDKVVDIYERNIFVNSLSLALVSAIADPEQEKLIRKILENRKRNSGELILAES